MDKIRIHGLLVRCIIGAFLKERDHKQDVVFDLTLHTDTRPAARSDVLEDAIDYKALRNRIVEFAEQSTFHLLEGLAQAVADICLEDERVQRVDVCVHKPGALTYARDVTVEITRSR